MSYQFEKSGKLKKYTAEELAEADKTSSMLALDQGMLEDGKTPYWAYIAVKPSKFEEFIKITAARQKMNLADYGEILEYGFDAQVPESVQETMKSKYGFDKDYKTKLVDKVKQAQAEFLKSQENQRLGDIVAMLKKKQSG